MAGLETFMDRPQLTAAPQSQWSWMMVDSFDRRGQRGKYKTGQLKVSNNF